MYTHLVRLENLYPVSIITIDSTSDATTTSTPRELILQILTVSIELLVTSNIVTPI